MPSDEALLQVCAELDPFPMSWNAQCDPLRLAIVTVHTVHMKNKDSGYNLSNAIASKRQSPICTQGCLVPKSMPCCSTALMQ